MALWKWRVCGLLLLASTINYMDRMTLASVSARLIDELHLSKSDYGQIEQYFGYAFACGAIVFGWIVDRVSVRWLYPAVLTLWSIMGILTGFVSVEYPLGSLLFCRTLLGFFESGHWPCALQTTQRLLDPKDWTLGNSVLQSGVSIGAIATPVIVSAMLTGERGSWRLPFIAIGAAGLVWVVGWIFTIRGRSLQPPAAAASAAKSALSAVFKGHRFWLLAIVVSCINGTWSLYRVWLPLALQDKSGLAFSEHVTLSRILPAYYLLTDVGCLLAGAATVWLHQRGLTVLNSRRAVFSACALLVVPGMALPALARGEIHVLGLAPVHAVLGVLALMAAGSLGVFPCYYSFTQELSRDHIGMVTGTLSFIAWVVPSSLQRPLGAYIDRTGSYDVAFQVGAWPMMVAAILLWLFWEYPGRRGRELEHEKPFTY